MPGKEIREAIEYERDHLIVCGYDDRKIYFVKRSLVETEPHIITPIDNPSGGEYYRNLLRISTYHAIRMPYVFMRDDKAISLSNTSDRTITIITRISFDYWAPRTMDVTSLSDPAGAPSEVIIHALD